MLCDCILYLRPPLMHLLSELVIVRVLLNLRVQTVEANQMDLLNRAIVGSYRRNAAISERF